MIATHLGYYNTSSSRTHVRFQFSTHAAAGGNVAPNSAFENADLRIYKATDGAAFSATQRSSSAGITMTSPFDSLTGFHDVDIDLTDNTDSGFYAVGSFYSIVLAPDETVDSQTITGIVLAYFEIGPQAVNVVQFGGTAATSSGGRPEVNTTHIAGSSVSTSSAQIGVNVVNAGGTAWGSGAITAGSIAADAITAAKVADGTIDAATFAANAITSTVIANDAITAAKIATNAIDADALASDAVTEIQSGLATASALATVDTNVDSILADTGTDGVIVATNNDKTDYTVATGGIAAASFAAGAIDNAAIAANAIGAAEIATGAIDADALAADAVDEILDETIGDSTITFRQALRVMLSALAGKVSGAETTSITFRNVADDTNRIVATVDADGNRTAVTLTV